MVRKSGLTGLVNLKEEPGKAFTSEQIARLLKKTRDYESNNG
jgi:hypothetical protein